MAPHGADTVAAMAPKAGVLAHIENGLRWINVALMVAGLVVLVFFCFAQAVDRYTIKSSFDAHDQLAKVGLVWLVFSGMSLAYASRENLRIDLFARRIPPRLLLAREAIFEAVTLAVCVLIHWKAWAVLEVSNMQQILGTPFTNAVPYSAILLGTLSLAITCLFRLVRLARRQGGVAAPC